MRRCQLDKIASVTTRLGLDRHAILGEEIPARAGTVVAARVLTAKSRYNTLEDVHGRMVSLFPGDVIAGALGHRDALYGYSGHVPEQVRVGDELFLLNLGGVIGAGARPAAGIGQPFRLEILGSVLEFPYLARRVGRPARIQRAALPSAPLPAELPPVVALVGTCMDSGKTTAASVLVSDWTRRGLSVAAGKLTGVSLRRDVLHMRDCGADPVADFTDFGVVTTSEENALAAAHSLLAHLAEARPDRIVLELGDGLLGTYGVSALLGDPALSARLSSVVLCAQDPVGALGAVDLLRQRYDLRPALVSGRVTDTPVGVRFCEETLGIAAWNALGGGSERAAGLLDAASRPAGVGA
ncbi:MAG: hypothetical protein QF410_07255 [Planctomycetota bacterium]|nr:hypothetical protein [Planctomycetota bacterium]